MSITDLGTPKKRRRENCKYNCKFIQKKKKRSICVNYYLRNLLFKTSLNNT